MELLDWLNQFDMQALTKDLAILFVMLWVVKLILLSLSRWAGGR